MGEGEFFERIIRIIAALRGEKGCPWDREQTPETVKRYLVEEAYEAVTEVENNNSKGVMEELGDLIFMTLFMAYLYQQKGDFTIEDVLKKAADKMIYRHPHVFGNKHRCTTEEVKKNWEELKQKEKKEKKPELDIPRSLPALMRAHRLVGRAKNISCPAASPAELAQCIITQLENIVRKGRSASGVEHVTRGIGECFLYLVCIARTYGINAEDTLHQAIRRKLGEIDTSG